MGSRPSVIDVMILPVSESISTYAMALSVVRKAGLRFAGLRT